MRNITPIKKHILILIIITILNFNSCKHNKDEIKKEIVEVEKTEHKPDSLNLRVSLNGKGVVRFNVLDYFLYNYSIVFPNNNEEDIIIAKQLSKVYDAMTLHSSIYIYTDGKMDKRSQRYLIPKEVSNLNLDYDTETYSFKENKLSINDISDDYKSLQVKIFQSKNKESLKHELDTLYNHYRNEFNLKNDKLRAQLNEIHYHEKLQMINPLSEQVDFFIKNLSNTIASNPLQSLLSNYVKNRINTFNYNSLNTQNYADKYIEHMSLAIFSFLRFEDNKGNNKYPDAKDWLKTTNLYKEHTLEIDKEITPLNNEVFKEYINNLVFIDTLSKETTISQIIKENPSDYYLIDFWATWCSPCIGGVKTMSKMDIPKNVAIISLSLDKKEDLSKWKSITKELEQKITYWLNDKKEESVTFLKFIELQSIPRYILIDKNMNLIDQAFNHPHEPQFLYKLKNIKNHQYW